MCAERKKANPRSEVLPYTYPKLHTGKSWYIDFMAYDPATGTMRRKKYMLDSIPKKTERRKQGAEMIEALTRQLRAGWSPWVHVDDGRGYTLLSDALDRYQAMVERMPRKKTRQTYLSHLKIFREWLANLLLPPRYVYQYDTALVCQFLDHVYLDRECGARTRNKYRLWCSALASFFIERQYMSANPVEKIKTLPEPPKGRQALSEAQLRELSAYLQEHNPHFLLACRMEYYTFIRPSELAGLKISYISISNQEVFIPAEISKNKRDGKAGLNEDILTLMIDLRTFDSPGNYYIFGDGLTPSAEMATGEIFRREWIKVRKALKWGKEFQFYSLKDSGVRDLANSEGIVVARDQARHTDVSTTNKYLGSDGLPVHQETKHFSGSL